MSNLPEKKLVVEWIIATALFYYGIWVATNVEMVLGATTFSYISAIIVSFVSILVSSLILINVSKEVSKDL